MSFTVHGPLKLVRETSSRVVLRYPWGAPLLVAMVFGAGAWAAWTFIPEPVPRRVFAAAAALFALLCLAGALWRDTLELDLAGRSWRRRSGMLPGVTETRGSFEDIAAVSLGLHVSGSGDDRTVRWRVALESARWTRPVVVAQESGEAKGYAALESWSKRLRRDAVDRTGAQETVTPWDALDRPAAERVGAGASEAPEGAVFDPVGEAMARRSARGSATDAPWRRTPPPPGSRIVETVDAGRRRISLPSPGVNAGTVFLVLFGGAFASMGGLAALVGWGVVTGVRVNGEIPTGPVWPLAAMGTTFGLIGATLVVASLVGSVARRWVEDGGHELRSGYAALGLRWGAEAVAKREVEGVDLAQAPSVAKRGSRPAAAASDGLEVRVRSDAAVLRLGRRLTPEEKAWLRDEIAGMVGAG